MENTQIKDVTVPLSVKTTSVVHLGASVFYADSHLTLLLLSPTLTSHPTVSYKQATPSTLLDLTCGDHTTNTICCLNQLFGSQLLIPNKNFGTVALLLMLVLLLFPSVV